ncbi:g11057 [Coccomyxa viridis]|uniref:G11057 protein n=1 Tax=Coccomyxa viridis TaxID=1274662 RepID=A0ABP1G9M6_9CHLO
MFGRRAVDLVKELVNAGSDALPPYNDEQVRLVIEEVQEHAAAMKELSRSLNELKQAREAELEARGEPSDAVSFSDFPEQSSAFIVHHTSILRNKRLLLIYTKERMDRIKRLRWQQRSLPDSIKINLSPQEIQWFSTYSRLLSDYMRRDKGIGMDLTLDTQPPKAPDMFVRVLQDCGNVAFSTGSVTLKKGSTHFLPQAEADHLIQEGVLAPSESGPIEAFTTPFDYI